MYEVVLNGIIHFFAIIAALDRRRREVARTAVEDYLTVYLGIAAPADYIGLFDDFLELYEGMEASDRDVFANVAALCKGLKSRLPRREQAVVILRVVQIVKLLDGDNRTVRELIDVAAENFGFGPDTLEEMRRFIDGTESVAAASRRFLFILDRSHDGACPCLVRPSWSDRVTIWRCEDAEICFMQTAGEGVSLDENPIAPGHFYLLPRGGTIRDAYGNIVYFSEIEQEYRRDGHTGPTIDFRAEAINFRFPGSDNGIHDFSCRETSGRLVGIMGGSGVGKSTLLGILNGTLPPDSGTLRLNGVDLYREAARIDGAIGMVPQDDLLFEELTVFQNLYFSARLCLGRLGDQELRARVDRVLADLQQTEIRDLRVGSPLDKTISGGQRKRLNIALELVREPAILFVDEPTSGLSSADSENVMNLLKSQAAAGKLVMVIIHQPSSSIFKMFDRLWIMDKGGYPIFMGNPLEAAAHFRLALGLAGTGRSICPSCGNITPEQIFNMIEMRKIDESGRFTGERRYPPQFWHRLYLDSAAAVVPAMEPEPPPLPPLLHRPGRLEQLGIFFRRNLLARLANRQYLLVTALEAPVLGLITAAVVRSPLVGDYVFRDSKYLVIFYFMSVIVALFLGLSVSAEEIVKDRRVLRREKFLRLSWTSYLSSKFLFLAGVSAIQAGLFTWAGVSLLQIPDMAVKLWFVLFSCAVFAGALGLNISSAFKTAAAIYILIPLLLIPQILLSGVVIRFSDLNSKTAGHNFVPWLGEIMASRWGVEALAVEQFRGNRYQRYFYDADRTVSQAEFVTDILIPEIRAKADFVFLKTALPGKAEKDKLYLRVVRNEVRALEQRTGLASGLADAVFTPVGFTRDRLAAVKAYLGRVGAVFAEGKRTAVNGRQAATDRLSKEFGTEKFLALKRDNHNRNVENFVLNSDDLEAIRLSGDRLVQLSEPVYQPASSLWGRAPFLAGEKRLGGLTVSAYYFNLAVIWLMTGALLVLLRFNVLARLINGKRLD